MRAVSGWSMVIVSTGRRLDFGHRIERMPCAAHERVQAWTTIDACRINVAIAASSFGEGMFRLVSNIVQGGHISARHSPVALVAW